MINIFANKKLHLLLWVMVLIYTFWGFLRPEAFTLHKWGTYDFKDQYFILIFFLAIVLMRIVQLLITIKKEKKKF